MLGSSRKLGGAAEHLIDGSEKRICRFRVRILLKGSVTTLGVKLSNVGGSKNAIVQVIERIFLHDCNRMVVFSRDFQMD